MSSRAAEVAGEMVALGLVDGGVVRWHVTCRYGRPSRTWIARTTPVSYG